jgi:hypothetical protein
MSTVEEVGRCVDIVAVLSGSCLVPGGGLPPHVAVVADREVDLEPYADGGLSDGELAEHALLELLDARLQGIPVRGSYRRIGRWHDELVVRSRRRRNRAEITRALRIRVGDAA